MSLVSLIGEGFWYPTPPRGFAAPNLYASSDSLTLDATGEEAQLIGRWHLDGGGSVTIGPSGSTLGWLTGASMTFAANSTLRVGVKRGTSVDLANGPSARATLGAAAFDVYTDLVGGTDTLASTTWRTETLTSGTPFTLSNGDLGALCWHLTTSGGTPSVKIRAASLTGPTNFPVATLVTAGPVYSNVPLVLNAVLTGEDGRLAWFPGSYLFSAVDIASTTIGQNNIYGNVVRLPFGAQIDALLVALTMATNTRDFALEVYGTPLGTPSLLASVAQDANVTSDVNQSRNFLLELATPVTLTAQTDYAIGVRQATANGVTVTQREVADAAHWRTAGLGAECYAVTSTAGGTFAPVAGGVHRRFMLWMRVSALEVGTGGGGLERAGRLLTMKVGA